MKKLLSTATVSVLALALAACSSSSPTTSSTASTDASSTASAATGNRVTLAKENDVISMDSTYATDGMSFEMIAATVEGLETMD